MMAYAIIPTLIALGGSPARIPDHVVRAAFTQTHDGWSVDEVLVRDGLNAKFVARCQSLWPSLTRRECNWRMLNQRKRGGFPTATRRMARQDDSADRAAAEIAARTLEDFTGLNIDRVLCDPDARREFDELAHQLAPRAPLDRLRRTALGLRKERRLQPELLIRVADWERRVLVLSVAELVARPSLIPREPGVYLFFDATGYLYIGEAANIRQRLREHLGGSDRHNLAYYLAQQGLTKESGVYVEVHSFAVDSPANRRSMRRAYESTLIASRQPRFNVRP